MADVTAALTFVVVELVVVELVDVELVDVELVDVPVPVLPPVCDALPVPDDPLVLDDPLVPLVPEPDPLPLWPLLPDDPLVPFDEPPEELDDDDPDPLLPHPNRLKMLVMTLSCMGIAISREPTSHGIQCGASSQVDRSQPKLKPVLNQ